jgi:sugar (pentulose or hexulose) kinase
MTSIGCHTMLWDFRKNDYHNWVKTEGIIEKLPPILARNAVPDVGASAGQIFYGHGLHDSSAALIPYLAGFPEPFVLISTGTWCISLNPFNDEPLTAAELARDCLCYLTSEGKPVKAARYFGGHEHEQAVKTIAAAYGIAPDFFKQTDRQHDGDNTANLREALDAYGVFMRELVEKQVASTRLAIGASPVRRIFVDGGFSGNDLYMHLLAAGFPEMEVCAAEVAQATALGAALAVQEGWHGSEAPGVLVALRKVPGPEQIG